VIVVKVEKFIFPLDYPLLRQVGDYRSFPGEARHQAVALWLLVRKIPVYLDLVARLL
jgi:hypothetical protein